jgi:flagellar basal body P-ring formation protein FlgA
MSSRTSLLRVGSLTLGVVIMTPAALRAQALQDLGVVAQRIDAFTNRPGSARLDQRLRLAACGADPAVQWYGTGRASVVVRCGDKPGWQVFVPINSPARMPAKTAAQAPGAGIAAASAIADANGSVVVARPLTKGAVLTAADLKLDGKITTFGAVSDIAMVVGRAAARPLNPGEPVRAAMLAEPALVKRGDPVEIKTGDAGLEISTKGVAEEDGPVGGRVHVRNLATGGRLQAVVYQAGIVVLPGYKNAENGRE